MTKSPAYAGIRSASIGGKPSRRLDIHMITRGCSYQRQSHGGCYFCALRPLSTGGIPVSGLDLLSQISKAFDDSSRQNITFNDVFIHSSGSFMHELEIPQPAREEIFSIIARNPQIRRVSVEARPENLVKAEKELKLLKNILGDKTLEIMMGIETANDELRSEIANKGFDAGNFEEAALVLKEAGIGVVAGLILKLPGLSEREGIEDAAASIGWLENLKKTCGLQARSYVTPLYIGKGTQLESLYREGACSPPSLWSAAEIIRRSAPLGAELEISLYRPLQPAAEAAGECPQCTKALREAILRFNSTQNYSLAIHTGCSCQKTWQDRLRREE